jgi:ERF superfamily
MHRSSDTIATIAAALAKAQVELTNPEKSLTATIRSPFPREADRTFRYAPLSSGLDIVRKCLGRHEIATIQSTEIDKDAGLLRLTTILAHSSGEWISSEWPVCQISDIASAQRMGAALTYARRYALFTLVGIAGEDDLDAPDLGAVPNPAAELPRPPDHRNQSTAPSGGKLRGPSVVRTVLGEQLSATLRESLVDQLGAINSADEAAAWAHRNLPAKNTLTAADAKIVEGRFQARLSKICGQAPDATSPDVASGAPPHGVSDQGAVPVSRSDTGASQKASGRSKKNARSEVIGFLGKTIRLRDKEHRKFVLRQACLVCGRVPSDPHHLTFTQPRALGRRVSDEFIVPVCRVHHRELHRSGDEVAWWRRLNIDPLPVALRLWQQTRGELASTPPNKVVKTPGVSIHDQARTGHEARNAAVRGSTSQEASESPDRAAGNRAPVRNARADDAL